MSKQLLWTVLVFVVALGSGIVIGMHLPSREAPHHREGSWLVEELKLNPEQQEKMKSIWQELLPGRPGGSGRRGDGRGQLFKERDDAIAALIPPERKAEYDRILGTCTSRWENLAASGRRRSRRRSSRRRPCSVPSSGPSTTRD